jgi:hypothetical protein
MARSDKVIGLALASNIGMKVIGTKQKNPHRNRWGFLILIPLSAFKPLAQGPFFGPEASKCGHF